MTTIRFFAVLPLLRGLRRAPNGGKAGRPILAVQTVRLVFEKPQRLARIALVFDEKETERTQEFILRWSEDGRRSFREIVRQQWNFSLNTIREVENYRVELADVRVLELVIVPEISGGATRASLTSLRLS